MATATSSSPRYDANGAYQWSQSYGGSDEQRFRSIAVDGAGNIAIGGWFEGLVNFGGDTLNAPNTIDSFVATFDTNGAHLASNAFGGPDEQRAYGVAWDPSGNVLVTGDFDGTIDFGGGPIAANGQEDSFIGVLDADLNPVWVNTYGDNGQQIARTIHADADGNIIASGYHTGSIDFGGGPIPSAGQYDGYIVKLDPNGEHLWSHAIGNASGNQLVQGSSVDAAGNVIVVGSAVGEMDLGGGTLSYGGGTDLFIVKYSAGGIHLWSHMFGDNSNQVAYSVSPDPNGDVFVTGYFRGDFEFGGIPLDGGFTHDDAWVAKIAK